MPAKKVPAIGKLIDIAYFLQEELRKLPSRELIRLRLTSVSHFTYSIALIQLMLVRTRRESLSFRYQLFVF